MCTFLDAAVIPTPVASAPSWWRSSAPAPVSPSGAGRGLAQRSSAAGAGAEAGAAVEDGGAAVSTALSIGVALCGQADAQSIADSAAAEGGTATSNVRAVALDTALDKCVRPCSGVAAQCCETTPAQCGRLDVPQLSWTRVTSLQGATPNVAMYKNGAMESGPAAYCKCGGGGFIEPSVSVAQATSVAFSLCDDATATSISDAVAEDGGRATSRTQAMALDLSLDKCVSDCPSCWERETEIDGVPTGGRVVYIKSIFAGSPAAGIAGGRCVCP
ncbi:unnamed protein product [Pedinophyceae sp. YPF-701]|nr:unnamed protein product [Pedinophyceae sp. YPF-701]